MRRMMPTFALLLASLGQHPESAAAIADRNTLPPEQAQYAVYLSLLDCPPTRRDELENVIRFECASLSSKPYLADQLPYRVPGTDLLRLDLQGLSWESTYPAVLAQHYVPHYRPDLVHAKAVPLVSSALWFGATIFDPTETGEAQYQLLYGPKIPKTADDFLAFWGIQNDPEYVFGLIEGESGVAVQRTRLIENRPGSKRNYGWLTRDSRVVAGASDPLETLPNKVKADAQELIVANMKWSGGQSGPVQAYFLADGSGKRVEKAPADIVVDHTGIRGVEILNGVSCISCHATGINEPTSDAFRSYIESGARVAFLDKKEQRRTDQYLTSDTAKEIKACQQQYADGIKLVNGLTPQDNARQFFEIVRLYHEDVGLEQAAREMYMTPRDFQLALADYSRTQTLTGRLAVIAQGGKISRQQWKASVPFGHVIAYNWRRQFNK